ncbi:hypothetical protein E2C01_081175 [Portunus trituberculatus]|uniref:Uncharacterized protein n=1 Tax=Portunus trituberculatus TaxID=210409 RepID=A0A5B7ILI4_PORTR|nr:hypothetical protein [Portunus trituberculatus]
MLSRSICIKASCSRQVCSARLSETRRSGCAVFVPRQMKRIQTLSQLQYSTPTHYPVTPTNRGSTKLPSILHISTGRSELSIHFTLHSPRHSQQPLQLHPKHHTFLYQA